MKRLIDIFCAGGPLFCARSFRWARPLALALFPGRRHLLFRYRVRTEPLRGCRDERTNSDLQRSHSV